MAHPGNTIGLPAAGMGNTIAFNSGFGLNAIGGTGNAIRGNSIYANTAGGINLSSNANDAQPAPTLSYATTFSGTTLIEGQSPGDFSAGATYSVDFFASALGDPVGSDRGTPFSRFEIDSGQQLGKPDRECVVRNHCSGESGHHGDRDLVDRQHLRACVCSHCDESVPGDEHE